MAFIPVYIFILAITIIIDYFAGIWISRASGKKKRAILLMSIISTCFVLFIFKYFNFFNSNCAALAQVLHLRYPVPLVQIILPIGLSFHTFQSLSYVIEVYRGNQRAEHHFGVYALYVMFYPQLVAGPIERPQNLLHQFYEKHYFEYQRVTDGLKLMMWGMFKKIVIADRLATFVNSVYAHPTSWPGISLVVATVFFAFQIYCDFSGYSDIAIGAAQVMGFKLMDNFNRPYFSKSVAEFWKRWHISLSSWFRDYLYIPLGGNRGSRGRMYLNLFLTFSISGLWHGANWTYVFWGALNGGYIIVGIATKKLRTKMIRVIGLDQMPRVRRYLNVLCTFSLICFSWIFFRAANLRDALYICTHLFNGTGDFVRHVVSNFSSLNKGKRVMEALWVGQPKEEFFIAILSILFMLGVHLFQRHGSIRHMLSEKPKWVRLCIYYAVVSSLLIFGVFNQSQFIYFQF